MQGSSHGKVRDKVQKWREMRNARPLLLWYSVACGRQQENTYRQVGSARASPFAFSPVAGQPRHFSDIFKKLARNAKCAFYVAIYGTRSLAASTKRNTYQQVGSARASPFAISLIVCQSCRFCLLFAVRRSHVIVRGDW